MPHELPHELADALTHATTNSPIVRPIPRESKMKKFAFAIVAILGVASTAHAQDRAHHHYVQRTDHYAQAFNYWSSVLPPDLAISPITVFGGTGIVVGTNLRCNACGAVGHYSCGARVPLYVTHYTWNMMP
jgi:hypothetical protein